LRIASPSLLAPASTMFRLLLSVGLLVSCANGFAPAVGLPRNAVAAKTLLGTGAQRLLSTAKELASPHTAASASKRSLLSLPFGGPQQQQIEAPPNVNFRQRSVRPDASVSEERQRVIDECFEQYNAVYSLLWQRKDGVGPFRVVGQYTTSSRKRALRAVRGDDKTFASESSQLAIPGSGSNLIATAARTGEEVVISNPGRMWSLKRRELCQEFGIKHIHFVPVQGGVMEYGRIAGEELEIVKLLALLMPHITQPASLFTFTSYVYETFWLLMLLVKVEQGDIFAGLSKAWVEFNNAALTYESSLKQSGSKVGAAKQGRTGFLITLAGTGFVMVRVTARVISKVNHWWARWRDRNNSAVSA